jgi:ketosteroid isomerase-like protein
MTTAAAETETTEAVIARHLGALAARDIDQIMPDYTEESVLVTPDATFQGLEQIRGFYTAALNIFTPEVIGLFKISKQEIVGEAAYLFWSAGPTIPFATDTFLIRDSKILIQTFAGQIIS